jgi:hypothetical protein
VREGEREGGAEEIRFPRGGRRQDTGSNCFATSRLSSFLCPMLSSLLPSIAFFPYRSAEQKRSARYLHSPSPASGLGALTGSVAQRWIGRRGSFGICRGTVKAYVEGGRQGQCLSSWGGRRVSPGEGGGVRKTGGVPRSPPPPPSLPPSLPPSFLPPSLSLPAAPR